ncbi:glycosyltransferase family 4 protein [Acinetobacter ihumii]|uniref:glycosyltransferase family 4 protein n=1 Tax=Acinetobacter ihumii TaxID=2483802 RepID=UPI00102FB324|nr:glycosyltransferase family 1 protein [Acinetobacter ihumii]
MQGVFATTLLKQENFPENFKFYFKNRQAQVSQDWHALNQLVRPKLKIAIVTETWPPEINGVALSLLQLCKGLQQQGHKILLVRPQQKINCDEFSPNKECLVMSQALPKYPGLQFGWPQYLKVSKAFTAFAPDVVHIVTEGPLGLTALHAARSRSIPVSSGFHSPFQDFSRFFDLAFLLKPIQNYLRWFHNSTDMTCVPSHDAEKALRSFGIQCPLKVVGRGVDTEKFSPQYRCEKLREKWGVTDNTTVMLYVGRLSPEKEIELLIETHSAMQRMQQRHYKLVIVGDGPDRARLESLVKCNNVEFTGSLTGKNLAAAYASADVFVFASQVETFGNVVLEAMASGLPVVAYDYACAGQYVEQQVSGWLSPLGQVNHFIQSLYQLPARQQLRRMGLQAAQHVKQSGWQQPVYEMEQALYQVVKECYRV